MVESYILKETVLVHTFHSVIKIFVAQFLFMLQESQFEMENEIGYVK